MTCYDPIRQYLIQSQVCNSECVNYDKNCIVMRMLDGPTVCQYKILKQKQQEAKKQ